MNHLKLTKLGFKLERFTDVWYSYQINDILSINYSIENGDCHLSSSDGEEVKILAKLNGAKLASIVKAFNFNNIINDCVVCDNRKPTHNVCFDCLHPKT